MFEKQSKKQRIIIYVIIALLVTIILGFIHYLQGWTQSIIFVVGTIEFFCIFYILYLPLKYKG